MDESPSQNQIQNRAMLAGKLVSELQAIAEQVGGLPARLPLGPRAGL